MMEKADRDLSEFKEVRIITTGYSRPGSQNAQDEVNRMIKEGWALIEVYTTCYSSTPPLSSQQEVHFVLGKKELAHKEQVVSALQS